MSGTSLGVTIALIKALGGGGGGTITGANRGLTVVSSKVGHSNTAITALSTQTLSKIAYDEYGHLTGTTEISTDRGLDITSDKIGHTNSVTEQSTQALDKIAFDEHGHITTVTEITTDRGIDITDNKIGHTNSVTAGDNDVSLAANSVTFTKLSYDAQGHISASATGKALTFSDGLTSDASGNVKHSNSITAQTDETLDKINFDAQGHITSVTEIKTDRGLDITANSIGHTNSVTEQTTQALDKIAFDEQGHITGVTAITTDRGIDITSNAIGHTNSITAGDNDITLAANTITFKKLNYDAQGHVSANADGKSLTFSDGITSDTSGNVKHSNSVTAVSTETLAKFAYDAQGHVTGSTEISTDRGLNIVDNKIGHSNEISTTGRQSLWDLSYDAQGHINGATEVTFSKGIQYSGVDIQHTNSVTAQTTQTLDKIAFDDQGHVTGVTEITTDRGIDITSDKIGHTNSVTAETAGKIGVVKFDAQGHITEMSERPIVTSWSATLADTNIPSEKLVKNSLDGKVDKYSTMPTATSALLGKSAQYIGTTTTTYKWTEKAYTEVTEATKTGSGYEKITDTSKWELDGVDITANVGEVTELPDPDENQLNKYKFNTTDSKLNLCEVDASYTHNYFYEVVVNEGVYSWQQTNVQAGGGSTIEADRGLSIVDSKVGHSNTAVTAVSTQKLAKVAYDEYGHITGSTEIQADKGLEITDEKIIHSNDIVSGNTGGTYAVNSYTPKKFNYDEQGHVTSVSNDTAITFTNGIKSSAGGVVEHTNAVTAADNDVTLTSNSVTFKKLSYDAQGHISANATGKALTFADGITSDTSGNVKHSNAVTAGDSGITVSGSTISINKVKYDAQGHITETTLNYTLGGLNGISVGASAILGSYMINIGHSNSVTAVSDYKLSKFTYDAQGHITGSIEITADRGLDITSNAIGHSDSIANGNTAASYATNSYTPKYVTYNSYGHIASVTDDRVIRGDNGITIDVETSGIASFQHTNSVTAQTTAKLGTIKYDAQGHITEFTEKAVVDNLTSTATDQPLSANQGKVLDESKLDYDTTLYTGKTRAEVYALITESAGKRDFAQIKFTAAESPNGSAGSVFNVVVEKYSANYGSMQAYSAASSGNPIIYACELRAGTWSSWYKFSYATDLDSYLPLDGSDAMTGSLKIMNGDGSIINTVNTGFIQICGGTAWDNGAGMWFGGKNNSTTTIKGNFKIRAYDGTNSGTLSGTTAGLLSWTGTTQSQTFSVNGKATIQFNSTNNAIEFLFS